ncbi:response regulator transcription factor [Collinsella tanakaei]|nr:response regulator transcription factor [Collinsella tanakaei]
MAQTVLIAEDDADIVELLSLYLAAAGFQVLTAADGEQALATVREHPVDVALVDIMMPCMNGFDFIRAARAFSDVPIIIVSARTMPADKIVGLDAGADGYISKPFDPLEVTAYVRAVLRRASMRGSDAEGGDAPQAASGTGAEMGEQGSPSPSSSVLTCGDLSFDTERLVLSRLGHAVPLTAAELKIMAAFMASPGRVFSKDQLYACVNGEPAVGGAGSVMVHISNIRAKLEDDPLRPRYIRTVRGLGYRLDA